MFLFLDLTRLSLSASLVYFFFYCPDDHRDLHSFPTRRSSDLDMEGMLDAHALCLSGARPGAVFLALRMGHGPGPRSEEHTSELQSLTNLVCRLLLEKKKTASTPRRRTFYRTSPTSWVAPSSID